LRSGASYLRLQSALRSSIAWLRETPSPEDRRAGASARLAYDWEQVGPRGHALEAVYRAAAEKMLATAVRFMDGRSLPTEVSLTLTGDVVVSCQADHISAGGKGIVVQRLKQGRLSKDEKTKARYAIIQAALQQQNPGAAVEFEHVSLLTGERRRATGTATKLHSEIRKIEDAFVNIASGRFDPALSDFKCPRCPYYFICPSHGPSTD
jgi:DNA helicase-2/ATP-dependent DNA helicase PcrA